MTTGSDETRPYHHGELRQALVAAALAAIEEAGPSSISLRALARRIGVSHAASTHHFRDKAGLLTAVAIDGYERLAEVLRKTYRSTGSFKEVGVAYVRFAITHRAHFDIMYRPDLYNREDPMLVRARNASAEFLYGPLEREQTPISAGYQPEDAAIAAWSLVHGFASLYLSGNLRIEPNTDPEELARRVAGYLTTMPA